MNVLKLGAERATAWLSISRATSASASASSCYRIESNRIDEWIKKIIVSVIVVNQSENNFVVTATAILRIQKNKYLKNVKKKGNKMGKRFPDVMMLIRAAVLAAVLSQLGALAVRPSGTHPGHAYFEQPCCGHSHLRHHKGTLPYTYLLSTFLS